MPKQTYDFRREQDGTWTVYVVETGLPAVVNDIVQTGKSVEDADDLMRLLNRLAREGERATKQ